MPTATADAPRDAAAVYRSVVLSGQVARLGQVKRTGGNLHSEIFSVEAYPYPYGCVGVVVNAGHRKKDQRSERDLALRVTRAEERERKRISRELHDSMGQSLTGLHWKLSKIRSEGRTLNGMRPKLEECVNLAKECMDELRAISNGLRPPVLEMLGLASALQWQAKRFSELSELRIKLNVQPGVERLEPDAELALFRVFQEYLSNVRRHAGTDSAQARLRAVEDRVILEVEDRGVGVPSDVFEQAAKRHRGLGLLKMRERVTELGGRLEIESKGNGILVRASVPRRLRE